jgi:hypothetical protein
MELDRSGQERNGMGGKEISGVSIRPLIRCPELNFWPLYRARMRNQSVAAWHMLRDVDRPVGGMGHLMNCMNF